MRRRNNFNSNSNNGNSWMVTFSDAVTLMITFFVLIIAMSSMDNKSLKQSFSFFNDSPGNLGEGKEGGLKYHLISKKYDINYEEFKKLMLLMAKYTLTEKEGIKLLKLEKTLGNNYNYNVESEDVIIRIKSNLLFKVYSYEFTDGAIEQLIKLKNILKNYDDKIYIYCYTTPFPISTPTVKNNVDLTVKRVAKIVEFLKNNNVDVRRIYFNAWGDVKEKKNEVKIVLKNYLKIKNQEVQNG